MKYLIILLLLASIATVAVFAQNKQPTVKTYQVKLTSAEINTFNFLVDKIKEEKVICCTLEDHVEALQEKINKQITSR